MEAIQALSKRFVEFFEEGKKQGKYKTAIEFCKMIDVKPQSLNEVVKGRSNVGTQLIQNTVSKFLELNPKWLFTGEGEMFIDLEKQMNDVANAMQSDNIQLKDQIIKGKEAELFFARRIIERLKQQVRELGAIPVE